MSRIVLTLPYPPSSNRYWRTAGNQTYVSAEAKAYKEQVALLALSQGVYEPFAGNVGYIVRVFRPQRSGDLSNRLKVLEDALNGVVWNDDKQVVHIEADRLEDKHNPRVEIAVWEVS